jgi:LAO/AO transport system kinase
MSRPASLSERVEAGDSRAIARAISLIEDEGPAGAELIRAIFRRTGRAYLVGMTGPPGAGKSTLVDRLIAEVRPGGLRVGVIAVDPTSPFTGGAVLGDRLRMQAHASDEGVFIRSMATRGHLGGLARATGDAALVLDAAGFDVVIIETVGVGQDEIDIVRTADVSIVTLVPGAGDHVQALKAGIMEIADIFVVNKADREDADQLVSAIEANLALHTYEAGEWRPPVLKTVATSGSGVAELLETIWMFRRHAESDITPELPPSRQGRFGEPGQSSPEADQSDGRKLGPGARAANRAEALGRAGGAGIGSGVRPTTTLMARRQARSEFRLRELVAQRFMDRLERDVLRTGELTALATRIAAREVDPYTAAADLLSRATRSPGDPIARSPITSPDS